MWTKRKSIKHFIYAKEDSEASYFYYKKTINSIKILYIIDSNKYAYDYKETIIEHFKKMSELMYDTKEKFDFNVEELNNENHTNNDKNNESNNNNFEDNKLEGNINNNKSKNFNKK